MIFDGLQLGNEFISQGYPEEMVEPFDYMGCDELGYSLRQRFLARRLRRIKNNPVKKQNLINKISRRLIRLNRRKQRLKIRDIRLNSRIKFLTTNLYKLKTRG